MILRKAKAAYEFSGSEEKINHHLFMDDLKFYSRNEKEMDSLVQTISIFSKDIGIRYRKVYNVSDGERKDCEINWYRVIRW